MQKHTNHLISESSPYLLQHAHNPVDWFPWNEEALSKAKNEQKLIIVSVGYAACHWCHVMEKESFENEGVAKLMNKHYVSIKVDREERPDVDEVYMDAANVITGRGGWPLNVIALPDGRPIFAGTYFRKDDWLNVLQGVQDFYEKTPEKAEEQAQLIQQGIGQMDTIVAQKSSGFSKEAIANSFNDWLASMDMRLGGRRANMKFPMPISYLSMMNYAYLNDVQQGLEAAFLTLDSMANGGIYDQIGGGFSRYSVDPQWHVPHFEKMLYDNAQLLTLYSEAFKLTGNQSYAGVIEDTIDFCNRELLGNHGAYFASLDADSEGEEGKFYVWYYDEVKEILGSDTDFGSALFDIQENGNWEQGKNVLRITKSKKQLAQTFDLEEAEVDSKIKLVKKKLFEARNERVRPSTDDKTLTSWNALQVSGLARAYEALQRDEYKLRAIETLDFLLSTMLVDNTLFRNYKNGVVSINGFLEDYAFTINALIDVYQITFDEKYLREANNLTNTTLNNFYNEGKGLFNIKSKEDAALFTSKASYDDNVIPSGNSQMGLNLFRLGHFLDNEQYILLSKEMIATVAPRMLEQAAFYYNWFELYSQFLGSPFEVAIVGENFESLRKEIAANFIPNALLLGGIDEGNLDLLKEKKIDNQTLIYVCVDKTCQLPVKNSGDAMSQIQNS